MIIGSFEDIRRNIVYALLSWRDNGGDVEMVVDEIIALINLLIREELNK